MHTLLGTKKSLLSISIFTLMTVVCFTTNKANAFNTTSSSDAAAAPTAVLANAPYTLYSGFIVPSGSTATATIPRGCPTGFTPYATIAARTLDSVSNSNLKASSVLRICQFTYSPTSITIAVAQYAYYQTATTLDNSGKYMASLNWAYGLGTSWAFPDTVAISDDTNTDYPFKNISYTIVCYPDAIAPTPVVMTACP